MNKNANQNIRIGILLAVVAVGAFLLFLFKNSAIEELKKSPENTESQAAKSGSNSNNLDQNVKVATEVGPQNNGQESKTEISKAEQVAEKEKWFRDTAATLDKAEGLPSEQIDKELRLKAKSAGASDLKAWQLKAQDPNSAQNERILATYLISLTDANTTNLVQIAELSLPDSVAHPAHSPELQKQVQEKALRTMAIDALYDRAGQDLAARAELERLSKTLQDPGLRSYAERKFRQLK